MKPAMNKNKFNKLDKEVPKYKKKTQSNTSKSFNKSEHVHEYVECLFKESKLGMLYEGSYCKECGKIKDIIRPTKRVDEKYVSLSNDEILASKKYRNKEVLEIDSCLNLYVPIVKAKFNGE